MIIKSILDTDLYKFTTSYAYMKLFPQARGTFEFIDVYEIIKQYNIYISYPYNMLTILSKVTDVFKDYNVSIKYNKFHDDYHPDVSFSTPLHRLTNGILSELIKVINSNKPYFIAYGPKGSSDMCIYPGSLNLTSEVITVGGIANARNSIFKLMKSNLISSNVSEECVTDKEFINFNDTY